MSEKPRFKVGDTVWFKNLRSIPARQTKVKRVVSSPIIKNDVYFLENGRCCLLEDLYATEEEARNAVH